MVGTALNVLHILSTLIPITILLCKIITAPPPTTHTLQMRKLRPGEADLLPRSDRSKACTMLHCSIGHSIAILDAWQLVTTQ